MFLWLLPALVYLTISCTNLKVTLEKEPGEKQKQGKETEIETKVILDDPDEADSLEKDDPIKSKEVTVESEIKKRPLGGNPNKEYEQMPPKADCQLTRVRN